MKTNKINVIAFSLHGVLCCHNLRGMVEKIADIVDMHESAVQEILTEKCKGAEYLKGLIDPDDFWDRVARQFDNDAAEATQRYVLAFETNPFLWPHLMMPLAKKYQLTIISDCPKDKYETLLHAMNFAPFSKEGMYSFKTGLTKEDPNAFILLEEHLDVPAKEILLVDSNESYIHTAQELGFLGFHYAGINERSTKELLQYIKSME